MPDPITQILPESFKSASSQMDMDDLLPKSVRDILSGTQRDPYEEAIATKAEQQVLEEEEGGNILFDALEILARPQAMIAGILTDAIDGGDFSPLDRTWKALAGDEHYRIIDVLKAAGADKNMSKAALNTVGFVGDIFTDPLMYVTLGTGFIQNVGGKALVGMEGAGVGRGIINIAKKYKSSEKAAKELGAWAADKGIAKADDKNLFTILDQWAGRETGGSAFHQAHVIHGQKKLAESTQFFYNLIRQMSKNPGDKMAARYMKEIGLDLGDKQLRAWKAADQFSEGERALVKSSTFFPLKYMSKVLGKDLTDINILGKMSNYLGKGVASIYGAMAKGMGKFKLFRNVKAAYSNKTGNKILDYIYQDYQKAIAVQTYEYNNKLDKLLDVLRHTHDPEMLHKAVDYLESPTRLYQSELRSGLPEEAVSIMNELRDLNIMEAANEIATGNIAAKHIRNNFLDTVTDAKAYENKIAKMGSKEESIARQGYMRQAENLVAQRHYHSLDAEVRQRISANIDGLSGEKKTIEFFQEVQKEVGDISEEAKRVQDSLYDFNYGKGAEKKIEKYNQIIKKVEQGESLSVKDAKIKADLEEVFKYSNIEDAYKFQNDLMKEGYFARYMTDEAQDILRDWIGNYGITYRGKPIANSIMRESKARAYTDLTTQEINQMVKDGTLNHRVIDHLFSELWKMADNNPRLAKQIEKFGDIELFMGPESMMQVATRRARNSIKYTTYRGFLDNMLTFARKLDPDEAPLLGEKTFSFSEEGIRHLGIEHWDNLNGQQREYIRFLDNEKVLGLDKSKKFTSNTFFEDFVNHGRDKAAMMELDAANLPRYAMPEEMFEMVQRVKKSIFEPEARNNLVKIWDGITGWWKQNTLVVLPMYHSRNVAGNINLNYLAGVHNPKRYSDAFVIQAHLMPEMWGKMKFNEKMLNKDIDSIFYNAPGLPEGKISARKLWDEFNKQGLQSTYFTSEFVTKAASDFKTIHEPMFKKALKAVNPVDTKNFAPFKVGRGVGNFLETNAKLANFIDGLAKGMPVHEASMRVKKFLFDYDDLTNFERRVMRRIFPFYTWLRKNIPLQTEMLLTQPGKFNVLNSLAKNYLEDDSLREMDRKLIPGWIQRNYGIVSRVNPNTGEIDVKAMANWIPMADLSYMGYPVRTAIGAVHPFPKLLWEAKTGKSTFTGKDIAQVPEQQENVFGFNVDKRLVHALRSVHRPISEIEKIHKAYHPELSGLDKEVPEPGQMFARLTGFPKTYKFNLESLEKRREFDIRVKQGVWKRLLKRTKNPELKKYYIDVLINAQNAS